jgi:hypothetical protein
MANPAFAFLTVTRFDSTTGSNPQQIQISYQGVIGDGIQQLDFASSFMYDNTLSQSVNLSKAKDALIAAAAGLGFVGLTKPNVKMNIQFN